jgi:DNA-3-methyladenine glycosylase II
MMQKLDTVISQVLRACPALAHYTDVQDLAEITPQHKTVGEALTEIIVSQKLISQDAEKILQCMHRKAGARKLWRLSEEELFNCGVSRSKARTIHLMGRHYDADSRGFESWRSEPQSIVRAELKLLWGLGDCTVDRLLLNYFGHLDIWPQHDLSITHAITKLQRACQNDGVPWQFEPDLARPYRSYLTRLLWQIESTQLRLQHLNTRVALRRNGGAQSQGLVH